MNIEEWNISKVLDISGSYRQACILQAAVKLGIFEAIRGDSLEVGNIADKLNVDRKGIEMLLNALVAMRVLEKRGGKFANTLFSKTFLVQGCNNYIGDIILWHHHIMDRWSSLDYYLKRGKPIKKRRYMGREFIM